MNRSKPGSTRQSLSGLLLGLATLTSLCGCGSERPVAAPNPADTAVTGYGGYGGYGAYGELDPAMIEFRDDVTSQATPDLELKDLTFQTPAGEPVQLESLLGKGPLVVVMTRGFSGAICPYCSTQTSRLIANYEEIKARGAEVVVVYPLATDAEKGRTQEFLANVNGQLARAGEELPPFPLWVDIGLQAVDHLGIRKDLSKPATYILDPRGSIRFAYVGESLADRPSIKVLLEQLDALQPGEKKPEPSQEAG